MDEKDLQNARQAYSMLCASLDDIGYHYQQNDEDLDVHFEVHGDGLPMELTISIDGERDLIRLLSFLPSNWKAKAPEIDFGDDPYRLVPELATILPDNANRAYNMYDVIRGIVDRGDYMDYQPLYATNMITCFAHINKQAVGIIANQPKVGAGCLDINASDKAARFIRTCDAFGLPLLTIVDVPGFLPGTHQEYGGIIRHGAKMLYAYSEATVPKVTVITRKAYGGAYIGMCSKHLGADMVFAWPDAEIAVMGADGAANIIFAKGIKAAADPAAERKAKIAEYQDAMMNPYVAAARGYVDDVIMPSETRKHVISAFEALEGKHVDKPRKKHGNIPL